MQGTLSASLCRDRQVTSHGCLCSSPIFRAKMLQRLWSVTQVSQQRAIRKASRQMLTFSSLGCHCGANYPKEEVPGQWEQDVRQAHRRLQLHYSWGFDCRIPSMFKVAGASGMVLTTATRHQDFAYLVAVSSTPLLLGPEINSSSNILTYLWLQHGQQVNGRTWEQFSASLLFSEYLCRKSEPASFQWRLWWQLVRFSTR